MNLYVFSSCRAMELARQANEDKVRLEQDLTDKVRTKFLNKLYFHNLKISRAKVALWLLALYRHTPELVVDPLSRTTR
jgi:hypothetical protein